MRDIIGAVLAASTLFNVGIVGHEMDPVKPSPSEPRDEKELPEDIAWNAGCVLSRCIIIK